MLISDSDIVFPRPPDVCLVFLKTWATEGYDRDTLLVDWNGTAVVETVASSCPNTVVISNSGGINILPFAGTYVIWTPISQAKFERKGDHFCSITIIFKIVVRFRLFPILRRISTMLSFIQRPASQLPMPQSQVRNAILQLTFTQIIRMSLLF